MLQLQLMPVIQQAQAPQTGTTIGSATMLNIRTLLVIALVLGSIQLGMGIVSSMEVLAKNQSAKFENSLEVRK